MPKGMVMDGYGKSRGKGVSRNAYGLKMTSTSEEHRHCPLGGVDRRQLPEAGITYTYNIPKPIEYDPNYNTTANSDRGGSNLSNCTTSLAEYTKRSFNRRFATSHW